MLRAQSKKIKAIITDLGGVIIDVDKRTMCAGLAKHSALSEEQIFSHFSNKALTEFEISFGKGLITPMQFYNSCVGKFRLSGMGFEGFAAIYANIFARKEESISLFRKLGRKYSIALLSNTDALHYGKWSVLLGEDMNIFKEAVLSFQTGVAKPDPEIYLQAAKRLNASPAQCVYIDDIEEYVEAARKVGMLGIHFTTAKQLRKDLMAAGINA